DSARKALEQAQFDKLVAERDLRRTELLTYFSDAMRSLKFFADTQAARAATGLLLAYHEDERPSSDAPFDTNSESYNKIVEQIQPLFESFLKIYNVESTGYRDVLILCAPHGHVIFTGKKGTELGVLLTKSELKDSSLVKLWQKVTKTGKPAMVDFTIYPATKRAEAFLGVPVLDDNKNIRGVLVLRLGTEQINTLFSSSQMMGNSTESFIVGQDFLMRSHSRFVPSGAVLNKKVETESSKAAFQGKSAVAAEYDYRGAPVLTAFADVGFRNQSDLGADFEWAVISKIDQKEALESIRSLRWRIALMAIFIVAVVAGAAVILSRTIAKPITVIASIATEVSKGDLTVSVPSFKRSDEIGALTDAFRLMVGNLRNQIARIREGVGILSQSATEISTTVSQVATSTAETSTAVTETTTTVEQVRQAARLASEKAKKVAQSSQQAVEISSAGKGATEDTVVRMNLIKEQMESIGETVVRLSEHSQAIEDIIGSVQDLADQSNLLAVNASIEAARAGDHGRGFAVVAQEIKTLADQSKQATAQVRTILDETRKWVSAVVMATEQGGKAVQAGVEQSKLAGESISKLSQSVLTSSQVASVIEASSEQQSVGVDQVSNAMASIEHAMKQSLDGTALLESSAQRLADLGSQLKDLVHRYKV
ncbi:MAG: methyl-accepting chemotaxis protein, partial [Desulfomonile sp.]|nr:methyl-accepting chemotaxis protein [Desulfomonile sp.]